MGAPDAKRAPTVSTPDLQSSGGRTRTPNKWTRTTRVTNYTTPEGRVNVTGWERGGTKPHRGAQSGSAPSSQPAVIDDAANCDGTGFAHVITEG